MCDGHWIGINARLSRKQELYGRSGIYDCTLIALANSSYPVVSHDATV